MKDFEELDEQNIENLDTEIKNEYEEAKNDFFLLDKKLKNAKRLNLILASILAIIMLAICGTIYFMYINLTNFNPLIKHFINKTNVNISSVSQITLNNPIDIQKIANKLSFIDDLIGEMYYYDKDNKAIEDAMFKGYISALNDKYAEYFPAKEYEEFSTQMTEGVYYGIGCTVTGNNETLECTITQIYEGSPAEKGGLKVDDIIIGVDGENVKGKDVNYLVSKIKGEEGTKREIEVYRKSEDKNLILTCYCGKVDIELVRYEILDGNIGYLDVDQFTGKAESQFKNSIDELLKKQINGLIIDLRSNGGGELMTVLSMLDYLVKDRDGRYTLNQKEEIFETGKTLLVYIMERDKLLDAAYAYDGHSVEIPMVVLTDFSTASAAELFTEGLRDYKKAKIVGTRTYGKGVVQNMIEYEDGSAVKFTTSEYFPPSGYSIDKRGILPDYSLDFGGDEVKYNKDNKIQVIDDNVEYILDIDGSILEENEITIATESIISTNSEVSTNSIIIKPHVENLNIFDEQNTFLDEDWFIELDDKYEDKQMLQAIVVMKDLISNN